MVPAFKEPISFEQKSKLLMFADFRSTKILLAATVQDFGAALLLGKIEMQSRTFPLVGRTLGRGRSPM